MHDRSLPVAVRFRCCPGAICEIWKRVWPHEHGAALRSPFARAAVARDAASPVNSFAIFWIR